MMERTYSPVSVTKCNSERQGNLKVGETSYSKSIAQREKSSHHAETEVMVERVSSTTEQSLFTGRRKPSPQSRLASGDKIPMSQMQRNREKHIYSKTHDNRDASKFKPVKSDRSSPLRERDRDRKRDGQHQGTLSASRRDEMSHAHSSMKKRIPRRDAPVDANISSSSLVLNSRGSSLSSTSTYGRKSSNSYSERDPKSYSKHGKGAQSSGDSSTSRSHVFRENSSQDASRQKHYWQDGEGNRKESSSLSESSKNRKPNPYKKIVEYKIREIRNNIEKMSSKEMVEKKVKEIRSNLEKMSNDLPLSLVESLEAVTESASEEKDGRHEESREDSPLIPFLPSHRCCSPPPRPAIVEKYWSDADETEDESDSEKHLMHVNSVNIVLNYLKGNSEKYYVDGEEITKQMNANHKKTKGSIKSRLSYQSDSKSHNNWSKSGHSKGRSGGFTVSEDQSEPDPYGLGLFLAMQKARKRDSNSRNPSGNTDFFDRKSLQSPSRDSHYYRSEHSPSSLQESFSTSRRSCSPSWCEDYKYMQSPSQKNRRGSRSPSRHTRHRGSRSPPRHRGSRSPPRHRGSRSPPRHRGSRSPSRHRRHVRSRSPSRKRIDRASRSPPRHRGSRSPSRLTRHRGSHSPSRHRSSSYRESCSPSRYRGGFHRNRESPSYTQYSRSSSPHYSEDTLSNRGSPTCTWDVEDSLTNRNRISVLHEQYSIQKQKLSPKSLHRYGIKRSHYSEDLCIEFMNPQKKSKTGSENYGANSREQHYRPEMNWDKILPKDRGAQLEEGSSNTNRTGHGSRALSPSHSDHQISIRDRFTHSFESSGSVSHEGSVETIITRMIRQESGFERPTSNSKKKNISQRWQQVKRENEVKLPLAFGRGAKKTLKMDEAFNWNKDSLSVDTRNNQRREDRTISEVDTFQNNNDDDDDDDDDEPIIDRPEDYLSASSTMTMYRPSFVPDKHDREKLAELPKTNRLSQPHEDFSMAGPSGFASLPTSSGKEQDDSPHRLSGSECDGVIENVDCAVPQVSSSGVSPEPVLSGVTTSEKSKVFDLSTALKGVTTEVVKSEKDEPALTLNSAEMSTLLTLIKLAKDHVATGKDLPSNFSKVLETGGGAINSKTAESQGKHSGKNQDQPSISQVSTGMQGKVTNENARATAFESVAIDDIAKSGKNAKATAESASIDDIAMSETIARATASTDEGMNDKTKIVNSTKAVISKSDGKQDKAGEKIPIRTSLKSKTMNNKDIIDVQDVDHIASRINKKIDINPEDDVPEKKKSDKHFSQWKGDSKPPQSVNKVKESKTDGRLLKVGKNPQQSSKGDVDKTTQEKTKRKGQSPKKLENKHVSSSKKNTFQQDEKRQFSKSDTKSSVIERTFKQILSVKVDVSASQETIALRKRAKHRRVITDLENSKKQLKQVGKRIFMDYSSDSEDDIPKKEESPGAGKGPQETSFTPDHPVSVCLACKCNLKLDEFTTVSLNTGIVTLRCRNCHTCRKMEKVLSLQCYSSTPKSKNVTSKESEDNSSKDNKTTNVTTSSKQRKDENTSQKDGSSQRTNSSKQTKKKEDVQQEGNIKEKKEKTPALKKNKEEKPKMVDAKNTSKTVSVFKKDKCQGGRKEAERKSVPKKDTNSKMNEEKEIAKSTSNDPHLGAPRWLSNTKMMGLFDNLELRESSSVEDRCNTKQQSEKSCDRRKPDVLSSKKTHNTTASCSKSIEIVKPTTTTKADNAPRSSDAVRISISAKSALNTDPKVKSRMSTTPESRTTTKSITTTASTQPLPSNATIKTTVHSGPNATSELTTTCKPCHKTISTSETKAKHITEIKAATRTECDSQTKSTNRTPKSNREDFCGFRN